MECYQNQIVIIQIIITVAITLFILKVVMIILILMVMEIMTVIEVTEAMVVTEVTEVMLVMEVMEAMEAMEAMKVMEAMETMEVMETKEFMETKEAMEVKSGMELLGVTGEVNISKLQMAFTQIILNLQEVTPQNPRVGILPNPRERIVTGQDMGLTGAFHFLIRQLLSEDMKFQVVMQVIRVHLKVLCQTVKGCKEWALILR